MNDDLLHAKASVDWPVTQLPAFKSRLDAWLNENIQVIVKRAARLNRVLYCAVCFLSRAPSFPAPSNKPARLEPDALAVV